MGAALAAVAGLLFLIYYGAVNLNDGFVPGVKLHRGRAGWHRLASWRCARRHPDRVDRDLLVGLLARSTTRTLPPSPSSPSRWSFCLLACSASLKWRRCEVARDGRHRAANRGNPIDRGSHQGRFGNGARGAGTGRTSSSALRTEQNIYMQLHSAASLGLCGIRGRCRVLRSPAYLLFQRATSARAPTSVVAASAAPRIGPSVARPSLWRASPCSCSIPGSRCSSPAGAEPSSGSTISAFKFSPSTSACSAGA